MKIAEVTATPLTARFADLFGGEGQVPPELLRPAAQFQSFPRLGQYSTVVRVATEDGAVGYGEAWGLPLAEPTALWVERLIAPFVVGRDAEDIEGIWHDLVDYFARIGHSTSIAMEAVSALDLALWDLKGRVAGRSVCELLGGPVRDGVECYVSPVMFQDDPAKAKAAARAYADEGFRAIKVKGGRDVDRDLQDLRDIRQEVGPDIELLLDVNGGYDLNEAMRLADGLVSLGVSWLEEPLPPTRLGELSALAERSDVTLVAGENEFTQHQFEQLLSAGVGVVMPNITRAGGVTGCLRIAEAAQRAGAQFSLHGVGAAIMQHASLQVLAALESASLFEVNRFPNPLREELARTKPKLDGGRMYPARAPGLGCEINEETIRRYGPR